MLVPDSRWMPELRLSDDAIRTDEIRVSFVGESSFK